MKNESIENMKIPFSITQDNSTNMNFADYANKLIEALFDLINQHAKKEIAFNGYRKNCPPLPIITTYSTFQDGHNDVSSYRIISDNAHGHENKQEKTIENKLKIRERAIRFSIEIFTKDFSPMNLLIIHINF